MKKPATPPNDAPSLKLGFAVKVKHGDLLAALKERGWTQSEGARFLGLTPSEFGEWVNLKRTPRRLSEDRVSKLVELTGKLPEELFPDWINSDRFQETPHSFEMYQEMTPLALEQATAGLLPSPADLIEEHERLAIVEQAIKLLSPRQQQLFRLSRDGYSRLEIAAETGLSNCSVNTLVGLAKGKVIEAAKIISNPHSAPDLVNDRWARWRQHVRTLIRQDKWEGWRQTAADAEESKERTWLEEWDEQLADTHN